MFQSVYQRLIGESLAKLGRGEVDQRLVEGWMRLEYGTLDHLGGVRWERAVREAVACIDAGGVAVSERLAESYGLLRRPARGLPCVPGPGSSEQGSGRER